MGGVVVTNGTPTVTIDLGTDTAAVGVAGAATSFGTTANLAAAGATAGQVLLSPGFGFPTITNAGASANLGAAGGGGTLTNTAAANANTINGAATTGVTAGFAGLGAIAPAGSQAASSLTSGPLGGGGGIVWNALTFATSGATGNANFVVSVATGKLTLSNTGGAAVQGRSVLVWGASGSLPAGSVGELALNGFYSINGGANQPEGNGPIVVGLHNGANANLAAGTNDFVGVGTGAGQNTVSVLTPNPGFFLFNSAVQGNGVNAQSGEYLAESNVGGIINFQLYAVSASAVLNLNPGDTFTGSVTATIISDPGASIGFDASQEPTADQSEDDGFDPGTSISAPEPSSLALVGLALLGLARRRAQHRA